MSLVDGTPLGLEALGEQPYADDSQRADYQQLVHPTGVADASLPPVSKNPDWVLVPQVTPAAAGSDTKAHEPQDVWSSVVNALYNGPEYVRQLVSGVASDPDVRSAIVDPSFLVSPKAYGTKLGTAVASKVANSLLGEVADTISTTGSILSHKRPGALVNASDPQNATVTPWNTAIGKPSKLVDVIFEEDIPPKIVAPPQYDVNKTKANDEPWFPRAVLEPDKDKKPILTTAGVSQPKFVGAVGGNVFSGVTGRVPRSTSNLGLVMADRDRLFPGVRRDVDPTSVMHLASYIFSSIEGHLSAVDTSTRFSTELLVALQLLRAAANSLATGKVSGRAAAQSVMSLRLEAQSGELKGIAALILSLMGVNPGPISQYTQPLMRDVRNAEAKESLALAHNSLMHSLNGNTSVTIIQRPHKPRGDGEEPCHSNGVLGPVRSLRARDVPSGNVDPAQFDEVRDIEWSNGSRYVTEFTPTHEVNAGLSRWDRLREWEEKLGDRDFTFVDNLARNKNVPWFYRPMIEELFLDGLYIVVSGDDTVYSIHSRSPGYAGGSAKSYISLGFDTFPYKCSRDVVGEGSVTFNPFPLVQRHLEAFLIGIRTAIFAETLFPYTHSEFRWVSEEEVPREVRRLWIGRRRSSLCRVSQHISRYFLDLLCASQSRYFTSRRNHIPRPLEFEIIPNKSIGLAIGGGDTDERAPILVNVNHCSYNIVTTRITVGVMKYQLFIMNRALFPDPLAYSSPPEMLLLPERLRALGRFSCTYDGDAVCFAIPLVDVSQGSFLEETDFSYFKECSEMQADEANRVGLYLVRHSYVGSLLFSVFKELQEPGIVPNLCCTLFVGVEPEVMTRARRNRLIHALNGNRDDGYSAYLQQSRNAAMHALNGNTMQTDGMEISSTQVVQNASSPMETSIAGIFSAEAEANISEAIRAVNDLSTPSRGYVAQINDQVSQLPLISMSGGGGPAIHSHVFGKTLGQRQYSTVGDAGGLYPYAQINKLHTAFGPEVEMTAAFAQAYQTKTAATGDFPSLLRLQVTQVSGAKYLMYAQMVGDLVAQSKNTSTALVITKLQLYLQTMCCMDISSSSMSEQGVVLVPPQAGDATYLAGWDPLHPRIFPSWNRDPNGGAPRSGALFWRPYQNSRTRLDDVVAAPGVLPGWVMTFGDYITWLGNAQAPTAPVVAGYPAITPTNLGYDLGNWAVVPVPNIIANNPDVLFWWTLAHLEYPFFETRAAVSIYDQMAGNTVNSSGSANIHANCVRIPGTIAGVIYVLVDDYGASGPNMIPIQPGGVNMGWANSLFNPAGMVVELGAMFQRFSSVDVNTIYVTNAFIGNPKNPIQEIWQTITFWDQFCGNPTDWDTARMITTEFCRAYPQQMRNYGVASNVVGFQNCIYGATYHTPAGGTGEDGVDFRQGTANYHNAFLDHMVSTPGGVTWTKWGTTWYNQGTGMYMIPNLNPDIYMGLVSNMFHFREKLPADQLIDPYNFMRRVTNASLRIAMAIDAYSIGSGITWSVAIFPNANPLAPNSTTMAVAGAWNTQCHKMLLRVFPLSQATRINGTRLSGIPAGETDPFHVFNGSVQVAPNRETGAGAILFDSSYFFRVPMEVWHYYGLKDCVPFSETDEVKTAFPSYDYYTSGVCPDGNVLVFGGTYYANTELSRRVSPATWKVMARWVARSSTFSGQFFGAPNQVPILRHNRLWNSKQAIEVLTVSSRPLSSAAVSIAPRTFVARTGGIRSGLPQESTAQIGVNIVIVSSPSGMPPPPIAWNKQASIGRYALAVNQFELLTRMAVGLPYYAQDSSTDMYSTAADTNTLFTDEAVNYVGGHYIFRKV